MKPTLTLMSLLTVLFLSACSPRLEVHNKTKSDIDSPKVYTNEEIILITNLAADESIKVVIKSTGGTGVSFTVDNGPNQKLDVYAQNAMWGTIDLDITSDSTFSCEDFLKIGFKSTQSRPC